MVNAKFKNMTLEKTASQCKTQNDLFEENGVMKIMTKTLLEHILKEGLSHHLKNEKSQHSSKHNENSKNSFNSKKIKSTTGHIPIDVPRD